MTNPLITVYITNYNYGRYIKQAIESVLNQSFQDFELFIIDDGSTDNSKELIESYANHAQINIIYQQNKGLNITNNIALRLASGKYIMRLDADDYLTPDALESMVGLLEADQELGMVFPNYYLIDQHNEIMAEVKRHNFKEEVQLLDQPAHGACTMIRINYLRSVDGYDESYSCQDGYELWIKFIAHYKVTNIEKALFYYRQHGNNLTSNENRILDTRRSINNNFVSKNEMETPTTIGIIPVRETSVNGKFLAFTEVEGKNLIDLKIEKTLQSKFLKKLVITSSSTEVEQYISTHYPNHEKVIFIHRPKEYARFNVSLLDTINHILEQKEIASLSVEAIMILAIEYIFVDHKVIDDAINALTIFKADSLLSVRPESATFYQHHGTGMVPILGQEKYTRLERELLYKGTGGILLSKIAAYNEEKKLLAGKVGSITVDQQTAHGIFSTFDLLLAQSIIAHQKEQSLNYSSKR